MPLYSVRIIPNYKLNIYLILTDKYNLNPMPRELFALDSDHHRKSQSINMQSCGAQSQWLYLQKTSSAKAQGILQKREWKDCKS